MAVVAALLLYPALPVSASDQPDIDQACRQALGRLWSQWRLVEPSPEVREWAKQNNENPAQVRGDFDGDGAQDVAYLILTGPDRQSLRLAACLSGSPVVKPVIVDQPYCGDGITRVEKGQEYYDFDTDQQGVYPQQGVHAYCFEKAGATYLFSNGGFRKIVDSD